ncbi:DUF1569 domain-containing protein [Zobellia nedashkovskayae]|uniref:DUF1569 domain-containing protein n=1 Tax=Zobellia nedashkovskayae TaxID=2779510 RepID=UPI00188B3959|nr:DUF1569 domain-containing protein [Zobellia nedashkovskayae]
MKNVFDQTDVNELVSRINNLNSKSNNLWGRMSVGQMMAHCNVAYDMTYTDQYPKPTGFKKFMIKLIAKKMVVGPKPYKRNIRTAPEFLITDERDFELEKQKLVAHLQKTQQLGAAHFQNKESHAFGPLTSQEWNVLFYKHLDHHLQQFNV